MALNNILAFIGGLGTSEVLVILVVILIFFGAKRIPELARGLGKGIREFKDATKEIKNDIENAAKDETPKQ
jgi:sec-independent protein translocase protein TatA